MYLQVVRRLGSRHLRRWIWYVTIPYVGVKGVVAYMCMFALPGGERRGNGCGAQGRVVQKKNFKKKNFHANTAYAWRKCPFFRHFFISSGIVLK